jgi:addiction module HigA family antidote
MEMPFMLKSPTTIERVELGAIHPGEILADELEFLEMTASKLARSLDIPANRVTDILRGRRAITPDTALRLETFGLGTARHWLALQVDYDLSTVMNDNGEAIRATVKHRVA